MGTRTCLNLYYGYQIVYYLAEAWHFNAWEFYFGKHHFVFEVLLYPSLMTEFIRCRPLAGPASKHLPVFQIFAIPIGIIAAYGSCVSSNRSFAAPRSFSVPSSVTRRLHVDRHLARLGGLSASSSHQRLLSLHPYCSAHY